MIDWKSISLEDLAGYLSEELRKRGINIVLVGGACASIYSHNRYQSYDLDFVTYVDMRKISTIFKELGFTVKDRYFVHNKCQWFVEFVSPPIAIGDQPIEKFEDRKTALGILRMLRPEDSVKDRLASYFYWDDRQGLDQAITICQECAVDLKEVQKWAFKEGFREKYLIFVERLSSLS